MTDYTPHMTDSQLYKAAYAMERMGGSFAASIAQAFFHADGDNRKRLLAAFGDLFEKFNQGERASMKTSELTGDALNWAVNHAEGLTGILAPVNYCKWEHGGPIIGRERIAITPMTPTVGEDRTPYWFANYEGQITYLDGPTPLIAAMRCYVASKLGDNIDIPEELK